MTDYHNNTTQAERAATLLNDKAAAKDRQRRERDAATFYGFGQSEANEEGGRFAKPTQVVGDKANATVSSRAKLGQRSNRHQTTPRLTGEDFATRLDRAVDASDRAKLIEGRVVDEAQD